MEVLSSTVGTYTNVLTKFSTVSSETTDTASLYAGTNFVYTYGASAYSRNNQTTYTDYNRVNYLQSGENGNDWYRETVIYYWANKTGKYGNAKSYYDGVSVYSTYYSYPGKYAVYQGSASTISDTVNETWNQYKSAKSLTSYFTESTDLSIQITTSSEFWKMIQTNGSKTYALSQLTTSLFNWNGINGVTVTSSSNISMDTTLNTKDMTSVEQTSHFTSILSTSTESVIPGYLSRNSAGGSYTLMKNTVGAINYSTVYYTHVECEDESMTFTKISTYNTYSNNYALSTESVTSSFPMVVSDSSIKLGAYNTYYSSSYDISGDNLRVWCSTSSYFSGSDTLISTTYSYSNYFTTYVTLSDNYSLSLYSTMSSWGYNNFYNTLLEFEEEDTITYINRDGARKLDTGYYIESYGDLYKVIVSDKFDVGRWYSFTSDKVTSQYSYNNYYDYNYDAYHATALTSSTYGSKYTGGNFYTVSGIDLTMNGTTYWYEDYEGYIDTYSGEVDDYQFSYVESYYLYTNTNSSLTSSTSSEATSYTSLVNSSENHVGNLIYISSVIGSISESRYSTVNAISQLTTGDNLLSYTAVLNSNETVETISSSVSDYATGSVTISYTTTFTPIEVASTGIYVSKPYLEDQFKNYNEYKNPRIQQSVSTIVEDMFEGLEFNNHKVQYDTDPIELDYVSTYSVTIEE